MGNTKNSEESLQAQITALQSQVALLSQLLGLQPTATPKSPTWVLIRDYLRAAGGSASPRTIADGLIKAGNNLGKYPLRNVKITVTSPMTSGIFRVTKDERGEETVALAEPKGVATP
jgi:hypothetical protein